MAQTLEEQIASIMERALIDTVQISAQREKDGSVRFYTAMHGAEGGCAFSELMNLPTVREAIASGIDALNKKRIHSTVIDDLAPMADAA